MRLLMFAVAIAFASPSPAARGPLDFLEGDWVLLDSAGKQVGTSHIQVQLPGAMIHEVRIDAKGELPVWFVNSEAQGGWIQLFPGPTGSLREFAPVSKRGEWPMVLGSDVILQDGRSASFRLTLEHASDDASHRLLEMSTDGKRSWQPVFDYRYVRAVSHR